MSTPTLETMQEVMVTREALKAHADQLGDTRDLDEHDFTARRLLVNGAHTALSAALADGWTMRDVILSQQVVQS